MKNMMKEDKATILQNIGNIMWELKHIEAYIKNNNNYNPARLYDIRTTMNDLSDMLYEAKHLVDTYADYSYEAEEERDIYEENNEYYRDN